MRTPHEPHFSQDIDTPLDDFYQVIHQTKHSKKPSKHHYLHSRGITPESQPPSTPKKPFKIYDGPVYVPAEVYKLLSPEAVAALKKYNTEAINKFAKRKRGIHVTFVEHELPPI